MKILTIRNVAGLGFTVFCLAVIADALPDTGSQAFAQSPLVTNVSSALANVIPNQDAPSSESLSNLLHIEERAYDVQFDPSLSQTALSNYSVRKVGFGNVSTVRIVTTPSGTYSTDGFASNHVLYPGVSVIEATPDLLEGFLKVLSDGKFVNWPSIAQIN